MGVLSSYHCGRSTVTNEKYLSCVFVLFLFSFHFVSAWFLFELKKISGGWNRPDFALQKKYYFPQTYSFQQGLSILQFITIGNSVPGVGARL